MAVLGVLARAAGNVVTRDELFAEIWPGSIVTDDVLTRCIVELRKAFGDSAKSPSVIETIPKVGFRLLPDIQALDPISRPRERPTPTWLVTVSVFAFVAAIAFFGFVAPPGDTSTVQLPAATQTIAVLPFVDMSPGQDQGYFADGLSEELINRLTRLDGLRVTGRNSSFYFKESDEALQTIGQRLSVDHVLEGSVRKSGDALRITAQLVDVRDGFHLWSETYERTQADVFVIQDEIADAVANALSIRLSVGELGRIEGGTTNVDAFEEVLLANAAGKAFDAGGMLRAIDHYQRAVELDPGFAIAWQQLASVYRNAWLVFGTDDQNDWRMKSDDAIAEALRLAPTSPHVLTSAAFVEIDNGNWVDAMRILERVADIKSNEYVLSSGVYTDLLIKMGKTGEAIETNERSRWVDPLHAGSAMYLAHLYTMSGRLDDAFAELERGWQANGYRPQLAAEGIAVAMSAGDEAQLEYWLRRAVDYELPGARGLHTKMYERLGDREASIGVLEAAFADSRSTDYYVVLWASYLGETDLALQALERSPDLWAFWLPVTADIRRQPEFVGLVESLGLDAFWQSYGWGEYCQPVDGAIDCSL